MPSKAIRDVGTTPGMLQKFYGKHGILAITWQWDGIDVVSGIWFADYQDHRTVRDWASDMLASMTSESPNEEDA